MKNIIIVLAAVGIFSCKVSQQPTASNQNQTTLVTTASTHNGRTSLDWDGVYRGVLPCKGCDGIETTVYLNKDHSYKTKTKYLGKSDPILESTGNFRWNQRGNAILLTPEEEGQVMQYYVRENSLTQLDQAGGKKAERYVLTKSNYDLLEKYWKLVELHGKPVQVDSTLKEPHIIFKESSNIIIGNAGCNSISGRYKIESPNRIEISKAISTQMACPGMDVERELLNALQRADNFSVAGDMLTLNKAKMAPLARFKVVYLK
jgi:heat shock protein HslJ